MRSRRFALALAGTLTVAAALAVPANAIDLPGHVKFTFNSLTITVSDDQTFDAALGEDPATAIAKVDAAGNMTAKSVTFPPLPPYPGPLGPVNLSIAVLGTPTGHLDLLSGATSLNVTVQVNARGGGTGGNCHVGPISLALTTGTTAPPPPNGPISGVPYNSLDGTLTLVDNAFSVPGASGCATTPVNVNNLVNDELGLGTNCPNCSVAGHNTVILGATLEQTPNPNFGEPTQLAGIAGCLSETGTKVNGVNQCADGLALTGAAGVVVSPDGENAYVASKNSNAVAIFDRNPLTGQLTRKAGTAGCVSETGTKVSGVNTCQDGRGLGGASGVAISPDGENVYVSSAASNGVAVFDRSPLTGALTQQAGTAGCITETGSPVNGVKQCGDGKALKAATSVTVAPNGDSVYVAAPTSKAIAVFDLGLGGGLTQLSGTDGCISDDGTKVSGVATCVDGKGLISTRSVAISPDSENAYVASFTSNALAVLDRAPSGSLSQTMPGGSGCISETGTKVGGVPTCVDGKALKGPDSVVVSPDGTSVYVASFTSDAVAILVRNPVTGDLAQAGAGTAGCASETGTKVNGVATCADGKGLNTADSIAISPGGGSVYIGASATNNAVTVFDRALDGTLAQKPGCMSETGLKVNGVAQCADGKALNGITGVTVAPGGDYLYATAKTSNSVAAASLDISP